MPPNPVVTSALLATGVVPHEGAGLNGAEFVLGVAKLLAGVPKLDEGVLGAAKLLDNPGVVVAAPPLLAPASFSCVRPMAAIPNTAPMAIWNKPAPCSVSGCH